MLWLWIILLAVQILLGLSLINTNIRTNFFSLLNSPFSLKIIPKFLRIGFAGMFLAACYGKILSPYGFADLVAQYQFLPLVTVNFFSLWLPVFELVIALGLLFTKWNKEFSFLTLILFVMFIIALTQALARNLGITCGCFDIEGAQDKAGAWTSLIRDFALILPLIWLFLKGPNRYLWDFKS